MNNVERDVAYNTCMPKLRNAGWEETQTCNIVDEKGIKVDIQTTFINKKNPRRAYINKMTNTIEVSSPIPYEEMYWFSKIGITGGFKEDEWTC